MCEFSGKLIGWIDRELPADEAAEIERHLEVCSECRRRVAAYKRVSSEVDAYCDAALTSGERRRAHGWAPVASAAAVAAALVALFVAWPRKPVQPPALQPPQAMEVESPATAAKDFPATIRPIEKIHRRRTASPGNRFAQRGGTNLAPTRRETAYFPPSEPVIQIAIPADAMFPPGAVPEGMHFVADVTIAADGSAERLRLHPRLAGFERRTTLP